MNTETEKPKHTSGRWEYINGSIITCSDPETDVCIAVIEDDGGYEAPPEEREANGYVLAAASDLLAALKVARGIMSMDSTSCTEAEYEQVCAAIAKAEKGAADAKA